MFSAQHIIWLVICATIVVLSLRTLLTKKVPLEKVLSIACVICALSEVVKLFTYVQMVPTADGSTLNMFIEHRHLPLHLCSIQILFIFYTRFTESRRNRETLLAFMYPTCIIGAAMALLLPTLFNDISTSQAFTHPIAYQFFLYHTMLIVLGFYIARSGEVDIRFSHLFSTLGILFALGLLSIYVNSATAHVTYAGTQLLSVETTPNFFFTYRTPIGIALTQMWQWYLYIAIIAALAIILITLFYLPFRKKGAKQES